MEKYKKMEWVRSNY